MKRRWFLLLSAVFIALITSRAAHGKFFGEPTRGIHFVKGGVDAGYHVFLPKNYDSQRSWPLVYGLAKYGTASKAYLRRWVPEANRRGYVVVCPDWEKPLDHPENAARWLLALRSKVIRRYTIDRDKILLTGAEDGGDMAYFLGLYYPRVFRKVALVGGKITRPTQKLVYYPEARYRGSSFLIIEEIQHEEAPGRPGKESAQRLQEHGIEVEYVEVEDSGRKAWRDLTGQMLDWFERKK